jgi:RNA 3'-terminal phosphate cyclase (ATP)
MVRLDGSYGEGGGQILRTALALSSILRKPIEIFNIRKNRKVPGLMAQHLTCVNASKVIAEAEVEGNELGSTRLRFRPTQLTGGEFLFDVAEKKGSAGSVTLVLQTLLPILLYSACDSKVVARGGTHVSWSPSFHYFKEVFLKQLNRIGVQAEARIEKWGFYPKGGGEVILEMKRESRIRPFSFIERGVLRELHHLSCVSGLSSEVAKRQLEGALSSLGTVKVPIRGKLQDVPSSGRGTFFFWRAEFDHTTAGFDSLGTIGVRAVSGRPGLPALHHGPGELARAEQVGREATEALLQFLSSEGALDEHFSDQVALYAALAEGRSEFVAPRMTQHLETNLWVIRQLTGRVVETRPLQGDSVRIAIG